MNINGEYSVSYMGYLANKVGWFDDFIAYSDTQNISNILVGKYDDTSGNFKGQKITLTRANSYSDYIVTRSNIDEVITVTEQDFRLYSNIGYGQSYTKDLSQPILMSLIIFLGFYIFKTAFTGVISWRRRR